jgi:hypothetical protein
VRRCAFSYEGYESEDKSQDKSFITESIKSEKIKNYHGKIKSKE